MTITDVKVLLRRQPKLKALASVTFDCCFVVRDIKVIQGTHRLFIAMPSRRRSDGRHKDVAHPLNTDTRHLIEDKILDAYRLATKSASLPDPDPDPIPNPGSVENMEDMEEIDRLIDEKFNR